MKFSEMCEKMREYYSQGKIACAKVVFSNETETWHRHDYSESERTYTFSNQEKYFRPDCIGSSLFASCPGEAFGLVRLDWYLGEWKVESCEITSVKPANS
jgi:hypothetical protein